MYLLLYLFRQIGGLYTIVYIFLNAVSFLISKSLYFFNTSFIIILFYV